jgi:hypothetical protein
MHICTNILQEVEATVDNESFDEESFELTEEEKLEREFDRLNLTVETTARGDDENYPVRNLH